MKALVKFACAMLALGSVYGPSAVLPPLYTWLVTPAAAGAVFPDDPLTFLQEESLPPSGEVQMFSTQEAIAPFEIKSSAGANYLLKLEDSFTGQDVMTVFVQGGNDVQVDVPLGSYHVKYASGVHWYGYDELFGPETAYARADETFSFFTEGDEIKGYSITLYKVEGGNLTTTTIPPEDF